MTTPEHTLIGIHAALAAGLHQRYGWTGIALAAIASNLPDWDGLPMLINMSLFERGHRVWGHNIFAILVSSILLTSTQLRYRWIEVIGTRSLRWLPADTVRAGMLSDTSVNHQTGTAVIWMTICLVVQLLHLVCDMVVSGGRGLSDWEIQPFWPLSSQGYVYPLIPWGEVGPTVILMGGAIALAKLPSRVRTISLATLACTTVYLLARS